MRHPSSLYDPALYDLYQRYLALPEGEPAELIDGEVVLTPRPRVSHQKVTFGLGSDLRTRFGGRRAKWMFLAEPEIEFGQPGTPDLARMAPDVAGWLRAKLPDGDLPDTPAVTIVPDFVCEVLSTNRKRDLEQKLPRYAREGIGHAWIIDPKTRELQVCRLKDGVYIVVAKLVVEEDTAQRIEPFEETEFVPSSWWE
jgi:Uma2 family endonuclease